MDTLRLIGTFIKVNVQMSLAYRSEAAIEFLLDLMWLGWELLSLQIIFGNTRSLGGWSKGDLIVLMGVLLMVNTFMSALIWPNTDFFNAAMHDGSLDYMLLQPVNNLFLVTFSRISIWRIVDLVVAILLIVTGVRLAGDTVTALDTATFVLLIMSGSLVLYSLWIVLIAFTFWFTKFDNNVTILQALTDTGRYPITVYPWWLRIIVTFIVPIGLATTIPVQALRGELAPRQVLVFLAVSLVTLLVASQVWKLGIKRYSGASS
ncbi:MAG TPA: ABC-2 family transporter protein [Anaerolineales bacterium]|nr:ABC-2 family transporter protein [Anaerolineales bacterium]